MQYKQIIINEETGEVLDENILTTKNKVNSPAMKLTKQIVDNMLKKASNINDFNEDMLYAWCKITKEINDRGQIKLLGGYINKETNTNMLDDITITGYTLRIINKAHNFSCILMKNHQTSISTWGELFEEISCKDRKTQKKVKNFLVDNRIIRDIKLKNMKGVDEKKFILNPFLFRGASYSSQIAIMLFQDFIKEGINMKSYPLRWLQSRGYINKGI